LDIFFWNVGITKWQVTNSKMASYELKNGKSWVQKLKVFSSPLKKTCNFLSFTHTFSLFFGEKFLHGTFHSITTALQNTPKKSRLNRPIVFNEYPPDMSQFLVFYEYAGPKVIPLSWFFLGANFHQGLQTGDEECVRIFQLFGNCIGKRWESALPRFYGDLRAVRKLIGMDTSEMLKFVRTMCSNE